MLDRGRRLVDQSRQLVHIRNGLAPRLVIDASCCVTESGIFKAWRHVFRAEFGAASLARLTEQAVRLFRCNFRRLRVFLTHIVGPASMMTRAIGAVGFRRREQFCKFESR